MKILIAVFIILVSFVNGFSQPYKSILQTDLGLSSWNVYHSIPDWLVTDSIYNTNIDSTINNKTYKIIGINWSNDFVLMREDTFSGKTWLKYSNMANELLWMDLTKQVGDTFIFSYCNDSIAIVDSVYYLNNLKHIRLKQNYGWGLTNDIEFIESVGTSRGLTYDLYYNMCGYEFSALLCKFNGQTKIYTHPDFNGSCRIVYTSLQEKIKTISILDLSDNLEDKYNYLELFNAFGQLVFNNTHDKQKLNALTPGIYFYKLETKDKFFDSGKIIVY